MTMGMITVFWKSNKLQTVIEVSWVSQPRFTTEIPTPGCTLDSAGGVEVGGEAGGFEKSQISGPHPNPDSDSLRSILNNKFVF